MSFYGNSSLLAGPVVNDVERGLQVAATVVPVAGLVAGIISLAAMIGGGCGQACISAAETEQIYEAAADNIYAVCKAGMLDGSIGSQICQQLASEADAAEAQLNSSQSQAGASNASKVISAEGAACASIGAATKALDLSAAAALYKQPGTSGWYASSLTQAVNLTNQILSAIAPSLPSPGTASATSVSPDATAATSTSAVVQSGSMEKWVLIGGVGLLGMKLLGVI